MVLAALPHFFDTQATRHTSSLNPFRLVRGGKHDSTDGKSPGLTIPEARIGTVIRLRHRDLKGSPACPRVPELGDK